MTTILSKTSVWDELDDSVVSLNYGQCLRLIMKESLFRVYAGIGVQNRCRFILLEIPSKNYKSISSFREPQGLNVIIQKTGQEKDGFVTCIIESASSQKNDIFSIIADDILMHILEVKNEEHYVLTIYHRLEKWKNFFKNRTNTILSDKQVAGLYGELSFLYSLLTSGVKSAVDFWNGPLESAQDFQGEFIASEIKTTTSSIVDSITISNISQLDLENRDFLYLILYKLEKNENDGESLDELIEKIHLSLPHSDQISFQNKLLCIGYKFENNGYYSKKYIVRNLWGFSVKDTFPRLIKNEVPIGVLNCSYCLGLDSCFPFQIDFNSILISWGGI